MAIRIESVRRVFCALLLLLLFALPASATMIWEGASLVVCYPGNQADLSSAGCPCSNNNECRLTCSLNTQTCQNVTGAAVCATGNSANQSVNGCACTNDNECVGSCNQTTHTCGGVTNAQVCSVGNTVKASANGCPCTNSNECQTSCSPTTDTCGGVVGAVDQNEPDFAGTASATQVAPNQVVFDTAQLSNGVMIPDGSIGFELYGPATPDCIGAPLFTGSVNVAGNGGYVSGNFVPAVTGTYRWIARYRGDAYNLAVSTSCNSAPQTFLVFVDLILRNGFEFPPPQ